MYQGKIFGLIGAVLVGLLPVIMDHFNNKKDPHLLATSITYFVMIGSGLFLIGYIVDDMDNTKKEFDRIDREASQI